MKTVICVLLLPLLTSLVIAQTPPPALTPAQLLAYESRVSQEERTYAASLLMTVGGTVAGASLLMQDDSIKQGTLSFGITSLALGALTSLYRPSVERYHEDYQRAPETYDPKIALATLQEEYRLTRYVLGGSFIGLGMLSFPKGDMTDTEHQDLNLYWKAAMLGLGLATLYFPTPAEGRYQEALSDSSTSFFAEPGQGGVVVGLRQTLK